MLSLPLTDSRGQKLSAGDLVFLTKQSLLHVCNCVVSVSLLFVVAQVMWLADRHSDQELYTAAKHCAKIHLSQLHQTEEFLNLPLCLLLDIIKGIDHRCPITMCQPNPKLKHEFCSL